jgi:hypothetical protein
MTDETSGETEPQDAAEWITALGIVDVESGGAKAKEAREPLIDAGRKALSRGECSPRLISTPSRGSADECRGNPGCAHRPAEQGPDQRHTVTGLGSGGMNTATVNVPGHGPAH